MPEKIASYKIINGNRYSFFCDLSGARVFLTEPIVGGTPEETAPASWGLTVLAPNCSLAEGKEVRPGIMLGRNGEEVSK